MTSRAFFHLKIVVFLTVIFLPFTPIEASRPPIWEAGEVISGADLIAVVDGPSLARGGGVSAPGVFSRDSITIWRFMVNHDLSQNIKEGTDIFVAQPQSHMTGYAHLLPGESLMLLRRLDDAAVERIRKNMPAWADDLPDEVWTFVEEEHQWMSWIQFSTVRNNQIDPRPQSILVAQLHQHAGVQKTKEEILMYIRGLVDLREAVKEEAAVPSEEDLDRFQIDVVRTATRQREQQEEEDE